MVVLALVGLAVLYGASNEDAAMVYRQAIRLALSFVVLLVVAQISPQFLRLWSPWLFAVGLMMLLFYTAFGPHRPRCTTLAESVAWCVSSPRKS